MSEISQKSKRKPSMAKLIDRVEKETGKRVLSITFGFGELGDKSEKIGDKDVEDWITKHAN
jgi:hypothetical protein